MVKRVFNFSPGPAALPQPVLEAAQKDLVALPEVGASVMEISHRSKAFKSILESAKSNIKQLLNIPDNYHILFMQGGASLQFSIVPMNLLAEGQSADYIQTGSWGVKAAKEVAKRGKHRIVWDGKPDNFIRVPQPDEYELDANATYVHFTSNETIQGVEFSAEPNAGNVPLVCDASSDILSRPIDVSKYGIIYAGAQKNIGPAGVTLAIVRHDLLERVPDNLPSVLDYKQMAENDSLLNTPPAFAIYMIMLTTRWLLDEIGGLAAIQTINEKKASYLYDAIDQSNGYYQGHANKDSRSKMNVAWRMPNEDLDAAFMEEAKKLDLTELKGHRSVGGMRASIYNAMPVEGCERLRDFMLEFQKNHPA